jgi:hypothetical protein
MIKYEFTMRVFTDEASNGDSVIEDVEKYFDELSYDVTVIERKPYPEPDQEETILFQSAPVGRDIYYKTIAIDPGGWIEQNPDDPDDFDAFWNRSSASRSVLISPHISAASMGLEVWPNVPD